ncbi:MAG: carbamoyl-phosphate synthase large subunit, partial [Clostridia bacterium]|nr:carbamoyl-phosphate synthase large subunit [Clostridia bacterium]
MPLNPSLHKIMMIGSGPIIIGQAAEFDYAGTQACRALKSLGLEVVLVNPNPATIMTDTAMADRIYIEPLTETVLQRIIAKEKPDGLISTMGGQNGLTLSMRLARSGFLAEHHVALLGAGPATIDKAEDRLLFKQTMEKLGQPCVPSEVVTDVSAALAFAESIGYPVIVRPAFTLGGSGGGIAQNEIELSEIARGGLDASSIKQILVERCISGWKEIEFEVMRDGAGNSIAVCSMENFDPVGVHTGDSIVVAPTMTLANPEYEMLRSAALAIVDELQVEGGCNVQFALHPQSFEYAVIEVNPRVSRSSALASKATGYPIAKVAAQIAVGLRLDEIANAVTGKTSAFFEPALDYIVVKLPKWPFDKFVYASRKLGTQMKATGEVMAIAPTFEQALMKAVRGAEISLDTLTQPRLAALGDAELLDNIDQSTDERLFLVYEAIKRGYSLEQLHEQTLIDNWFLAKLANLAAIEQRLATEPLTQELYHLAKVNGYPDRAIARLCGQELPPHLPAAYKMVDTCAGEFEAETPYFYAAYDTRNEADEFLSRHASGKKRIVVFGSGPIRIGQGIEFDYASVHCVRTLKSLGYEVIMVNNNPETVSTDFDTADRLYFEPLFDEDVMDILATEQPFGTVVAFGGQTAIKLTKALAAHGVPILGTSADSIDIAEDRERFDAILNSLHAKRPEGRSVYTKQAAIKAANELGYPVLVRPSYVLGGQNMSIAFEDEAIERYMDIILASGPVENPILVDKYLMGQEVEVHAICDGEHVLIPGIMEHIERAGVHSGDSIAVYPPWNISGPLIRELVELSTTLALALETKGLINIQFVIHHNRIYIIEANPRASRTIPYMSKVTGLPIVELATRAMLGEKLTDMGYGLGLYREPVCKAVKAPVFSFEKLTGVDTTLGPEMKSTGEVLGIGR